MSFFNDNFTQPVLDWFDRHGRSQLPWQHPRSGYFVWLSEIMLQQTQVNTVIPYFNRFIAAFPSIEHLAKASEDEVLKLWSGLGYYARGRNLHKTAKIITSDFQGFFPDAVDELVKLPGIGRSTAAAIASQAFNRPTAILDGNVKRVLSRFFLVDGELNQSATVSRLWSLADQCMPRSRCADYTQAIMDFGAICCTSKRPSCEQCPLQKTCQAKQLNCVENYPNKKQRKPLPEKHRQFLLIYNHCDQIYLEKRPSHGIWGGLWCMPEIEMEQSAQQHIEQSFPCEVLTLQTLKHIKHTFTHFRLFINALSIQIKLNSEGTYAAPGGWFSAEETSRLGLAKPIMDLIQTFSQKY